MILFFLGSYIRPDRLLIHPNRGNKIPPGPEILPRKVLPLPKIYPRNLDGALSLEKPYHLRNGILGANRDQHVNMVGLWEAFSFFPVCQLPEMSNAGSPPAEPGVYLKEINR